MKRLFGIVILLLAVSACTPYLLVPVGPQTLNDQVKVQVPHEWNQRTESSLKGTYVSLWTVDGPALETLTFHVGVEDGQTLYSAIDYEDQQNPLLKLLGIEKDRVSFRFFKTMSEHDLMDLFAGSAAMISQQKVLVTPGHLAPFSLGGQPGFRFDYTMETAVDGVKRKGFVVGAIVGGKLTLVDYRGAALHHFELRRPDAEAIIASLSFTSKSSGALATAR